MKIKALDFIFNIAGNFFFLSRIFSFIARFVIFFELMLNTCKIVQICANFFFQQKMFFQVHLNQYSCLTTFFDRISLLKSIFNISVISFVGYFKCKFERKSQLNRLYISVDCYISKIFKNFVNFEITLLFSCV